jgi:tripartite-type tricarboxylate transporter receptor subunit TctC
MKKIGVILIVCAIASGVFTVWGADDYPVKPIQLVCPYGAGGLTDIVARFVADKMVKYLGKPIFVVNKPGGGTAIGTGYVAASKPDGYTILINMTGGFIVTPLITPNLPYKMSDFIPVGKIITADYLILVNKELPVNTLLELVAYVKKNPGKLSYGSPGVGTVNHLVMELLNSQGQTDMQHIPFTSELQILTALMGNHIQAGAVTAPFSLKYINTNQVRAVAVLAEKRDPLIPELATSGEEGFPELVASIYNILFVPAKTPAPVVKKLEEALQKTLRDKEVVESLEKMDFKIDFLNSADTQAFLDREVKKWASVVKKANIVIK